MTDTVLVLAWLVFAHLVADFVLQNDWIALNKTQDGRKGWQALGVHGLHVGLCLLPAVFAFGLPGLVYVVVGVLTWIALYNSGVDPVVVGLAMGLLTYAGPAARAKIARVGPLRPGQARGNPTPGRGASGMNSAKPAAPDAMPRIRSESGHPLATGSDHAYSKPSRTRHRRRMAAAL